ncbi:MAG: metal-dependent transcriptional regulator [Anaerolineae bacterium]|nr:metal-dependent transcriptional regulator [Anaerolineae bacterium]
MTDKTDPLQSESVQNFLKSIYALQQGGKRVSTNEMAGLLNISAPSVTDMAQRLEEVGLVDYQKYRGVMLTPAGEEEALKILRRHRLIELYLVQELGYELYEVHSEAERLEHAVSDRFIEAIAARLGDPGLDPHGDPIPSADGIIERRDLKPLSDWPLGVPAVIARIRATNDEMLQHIVGRGLQLHTQIEVLGRDPFEGPLTVRVDQTQQIVGYNVATCILVEVLSDSNP